MKFLGWEFGRAEAKQAQFDDVLQRLAALQESGGVGAVTPDNCMKSPTVNAIVTAVSRRLAVSPCHVYEKTTSKGLDSKKRLPDHPVAKLLRKPNGWQSRNDYWLDATSCFVRWGRFHAYKGRGQTGPIRELIPLHPREVDVKRDENYRVSYHVLSGGERKEYSFDKIHTARGASRDFLCGDSPVNDVQVSIALEIAAEAFGASFYANGALPLLIFKYQAGMKPAKGSDQEKSFIEKFQEKFGGRRRHKALMLPAGMEEKVVDIANDKAQMIESRKHQRTVIAGAFGVPPHLVGDLERATFNNVEQQDADFTSNVVQPVAQAFEAAMERDLLTDADRAGGIIIRFNLDSILRADFKSRQEGLRVQRDAGVISANEWREIEGKNPLSDDDGGNDYMRPANMLVAGEEPPAPPAPPKPGKPEDANAEADGPA